MPDEKVTRILLARTDMTKEVVAKFSTAEAWRLVYGLPKPKKNRPRLLEVCFTGFGVSEKERLGKLAEQAGMRVRKGVTKELDFLCTGPNAGPKKLEHAHEQGVELLTKDEFLALVESGELPDKPRT